MVAANVHVVGKGTQGAIISLGLSGVDDSALYVFVIATFLVYWARDSSRETAQANMRYACMAAALSAGTLWSTFLFKVRNWDHSMASMVVGDYDPCNSMFHSYLSRWRTAR